MDGLGDGVSVECAFNIYGHIMKCWAAIKTVNYLILFLFPLRARFCVLPQAKMCTTYTRAELFMILLTLAFEEALSMYTHSIYGTDILYIYICNVHFL